MGKPTDVDVADGIVLECPPLWPVAVDLGEPADPVALMTGYGDFLFGVYGGIDLGLTSGAGAWDFNGNRWLGIGLSTKLPFNL